MRSLENIERLMKQLIAIQLYLGGARQDQIGTNIKVAKETVNGMVKGIKRQAIREGHLEDGG
jgi:Mn-dependent DtxR family transcriptional regulator